MKSEIKQDIASVKSEMAIVNDKINLMLQMMGNITKPQGGIAADCNIRETVIYA